MQPMLRTLSVLLYLLLPISLLAQQPTQSIRGTVVDEASNMPLAYVSVGLKNTVFGTLTDSAGHFALSVVPVGTYGKVIALIGYERVILREVQSTATKEVFLNISMRENPTAMNEVVVRPEVNRAQRLISTA